MVPWALFTVGLVALGLSANLFWPLGRPSPVAPISFFAGWLAGELAPQLAIIELAAAVILMAAGGLAEWPGWVGLLTTSGALYGLQRAHAESDRVLDALPGVLADAFGPDSLEATADFERPSWRDVARPFSPHRGDVVRVRNIPFAPKHGQRGMLDLLYGADSGCGLVDPSTGRGRGQRVARPVFLYVHGGGWIISKKEHQGLPLLNLLASRGWLCVSTNYRLSPGATFPDHLIDVKRALAWTREHIERYGGDPNFVVISGGSAGGHLAALAALTPNDRGYQPNFEEVDTSVQGCVPLYGIFDLADRRGTWPHGGMRLLLERVVIKQRLSDAASVFEAGSPITRLAPGAPPFMVVHGTRDTMVPFGESASFVEAYREIVGQGAVLAAIEGAQHAFDVFKSRRTLLVNQAIARYVDGLWRRRQPVGLLAATPRFSLVRSRSGAIQDARQKPLETGRRTR